MATPRNCTTKKQTSISEQLREDGIDRMTEAHVMQNYQLWGFNAPFTLPKFRRNEVWLDLTFEEVEVFKTNLKQKK